MAVEKACRLSPRGTNLFHLGPLGDVPRDDLSTYGF